VISSIHFVDGIVVADIGKLIPSNVDVKAFYRHYFALIKEMIAVQDFDCVGHLDVLRRAAPAIPFIDYERDIDDIASLLLKHDKGFEVNTSGFRYGNGGPYPCFDIIKRLYDRGVRKVTIGSDCHAVDDFDAGLAEGIAMLKKAGYSQICTFEKRKARFMDI
jgi:histidinol-phosphatase (PHP family)